MALATGSFSTWIAAVEVGGRWGLVSTQISAFCTPRSLLRLPELGPDVFSSPVCLHARLGGSLFLKPQGAQVKTPSAMTLLAQERRCDPPRRLKEARLKNSVGEARCAFHCG